LLHQKKRPNKTVTMSFAMVLPTHPFLLLVNKNQNCVKSTNGNLNESTKLLTILMK